jgi:hypothetical protein
MRELSFRPRARLNVFTLYGLTGLSLSGVVHFMSYSSSTIGTRHPLFWALHVAIFPLWFAYMFHMRRWYGESEGIFGFRRRKLLWRELIPHFPSWVLPCLVVLAAYTFVNFFVATDHLSTGTGGTITSSDSSADSALYTIRAFSGHWLLFYAIPSLYFLFVPRNARASPAPSEAAV